jgi:hypothetical protein
MFLLYVFPAEMAYSEGLRYPRACPAAWFASGNGCPLGRPFAGAAEEVETVVVSTQKADVHQYAGVDAGVISDIRGRTYALPESACWKEGAGKSTVGAPPVAPKNPWVQPNGH